MGAKRPSAPSHSAGSLRALGPRAFLLPNCRDPPNPGIQWRRAFDSPTVARPTLNLLVSPRHREQRVTAGGFAQAEPANSASATDREGRGGGKVSASASGSGERGCAAPAGAKGRGAVEGSPTRRRGMHSARLKVEVKAHLSIRRRRSADPACPPPWRASLACGTRTNSLAADAGPRSLPRRCADIVAIVFARLARPPLPGSRFLAAAICIPRGLLVNVLRCEILAAIAALR